MARVRYQRLSDEDALSHHLTALGARTVIVDVEPLVAHWHSGQDLLHAGVARIAHLIAALPNVSVVGFATNSRRSVDGVPESDARVFYLALAGKPLRTRPFRHLPAPGVVVGDQVVTDGVLAWRLGYAFLHYTPPLRPRSARR